jgi:hypothetical protein
MLLWVDLFYIKSMLSSPKVLDTEFSNSKGSSHSTTESNDFKTMSLPASRVSLKKIKGLEQMLLEN